MSKKINISDCGNCYNEDVLIKYINDELSDAENIAIESHLANCEMCSDVVDGLLMMDSPTLLLVEKKNVDKEIDKLISKKNPPSRINIIRSIAAVALLLIISGTYFVSDYLISKKEITKIQTAETQKDFDSINKMLPPEETEIAEITPKIKERDELSTISLLKSPLHDFDSDYKVISNAEDYEKTTLEEDKLFETLSGNEIASNDRAAPREKSDGAGGYFLNGDEVDKTEDTRSNSQIFGDVSTGTVSNQPGTTVLQKTSGGVFSIFDNPERKHEEKNTRKLNDKEKREFDGVDSRQNSQESATPISEMSIADESEQDSEPLIITKFESVDDDLEEEVEVIAFMSVEEKPQFPGGDDALLQFIAKNIIYPTVAKENSVQGSVYVQFVIDKGGFVKDVQIVKGVDPSLDAEAIRVIKMLPQWTPGKQRGVSVNVSYLVPIRFNLE